ncbi:hypothetical protein BDZ89DRAFT_1090801 [Hymenopellis radicata]|nr:hypothetical protein BDZ89DRAFT_1090801 [Hymenopellis radicata]
MASIASQKASSTRSPMSRPAPQPITLAKRLLFPTLPTEDLPLLLISPVPPELNAELYEFIALALRAFVNPWWTKITRYDKEFLPEITRILTYVVRVLEARVLATDFAPLLCRDVPTIVTQHYRDYRNAKSKLTTSYAAGGALPLNQIFHQLQPHMAVSPDGQIDEVYFRQVVDHILKTCLPPEDSAPEAERFIVREIIVKILLKDIIPKITQPWFIQKSIVDLLGPQPLPSTQPAESPLQLSPSAISFHTLIILFLSAIQSISGACLALIHTYKQAVNTIKLVNQTPRKGDGGLSPKPEYLPHSSTLQRTTSSHYESRLSPSLSRAPSVSSSMSSPPSPASSSSSFDENVNGAIQPHYVQAPLHMVAEVFSMGDRFASSVIETTARMLASFFAPFLDRLLPFIIHRTLSPMLVLNIVRIGKRTLFPNGYPAPPPIDPTPEEQAQILAKLLAWRGRGGTCHDLKHGLQSAVEPLSNASCNVHLIVMLLDRVVVALFPELIGSPPSER